MNLKALPIGRFEVAGAVRLAAPAAVAALVMALGVAFAGAASDARRETQRLTASARTIAAMAAYAVASGDGPAAGAVLNVTGPIPGVAYRRIERSDGRRLAEAGVTAETRMAADMAQPGVRPGLKSRFAQIIAPIPGQGRPVGQVVLLTRSPGVLDRLGGLFGLGLVAVAVAAGVAAAGGRRGPRKSSGAVRAVKAAMAEAAASPGLAPRLDPAHGPDADLVDAYNGMLTAMGRLRAQEAARARRIEAEAAAQAAAIGLDIQAPLAGLAARLRAEGHEAASAVGGLATALGQLLSPRGPATPASMDLAALAEDVVGLLSAEADARRLDLALYVDPALPARLLGQEASLRSVLSRLILGSLRHTQTGGVIVEIEPSAADRLRITIRDTGPGFPAETLVALGQAGDRAGGLFDVKRAVEAMAGAFKASNAQGRGGVVAIQLPMAAEAPAADWPKAPREGQAVVIDHPGAATRRALSRYLARAGYRPAAPGEEAAAAPALLIATPEAMKAAEVGHAPEVVIARPGDEAAATLSGLGRAQAMLTTPPRREAVAKLLKNLAAGRPLAGRPVSAASLDADSQALLADLDLAIERGELSMVYQPQYDRDGRDILGVEALVRWTHPTRGAVPPSLFIPLAESHGRINQLTDWVLRRSIEETAPIPNLPIAFNASALEFSHEGVAERIAELVAETGFDPRRLEVEITETAILNNESRVKRNMAALKDIGLRVALDDFGAGHSSLSHLRRYPFDKLKIDREFIMGCTGDVESATVVHAVVSIGRALGMKVVAEGVETEAQRQFLKIAGVHAMQGYLFGRPMPIEELKALMGVRPQALAG